MAKIGLIGAGSWGTALSKLAADNGHEVAGDSTATSACGISSSMISDSVISVFSSTPFATLTMICRSPTKAHYVSLGSLLVYAGFLIQIIVEPNVRRVFVVPALPLPFSLMSIPFDFP